MPAHQVHAELIVLLDNIKITGVCSLWPPAAPTLDAPPRLPHPRAGLSQVLLGMVCLLTGLRLTHTLKVSVLALKGQ